MLSTKLLIIILVLNVAYYENDLTADADKNDDQVAPTVPTAPATPVAPITPVTPKPTLKEIIQNYEQSLVYSDKYSIYPEIVSPFQRNIVIKSFNKLYFNYAPCGYSYTKYPTKTKVVIDNTQAYNFKFYIHGTLDKLITEPKPKANDPNSDISNDTTNKLITLKKPKFPTLFCRIKLFKGNESASEYYYLTSEYIIKWDKSLKQSEIDSMTYFDCSHAVRNTYSYRLNMPDVECSPCTLSLEVWEPKSNQKFYNCSDVSLVDPTSFNLNESCVNKCLNRGVCMNGRCHCEFFYRGQFCESYIGSSFFKAIIWFTIYILIIAAIAIVIWKWKEITLEFPEWMRRLREMRNNYNRQEDEEDN